MEGMIGEIRAVAESIFLGGNWVFLGMVILAALVGVFAMRSVGQIICVSVLAMVVLGLLWLVYGGATSEAPTSPGSYLSQLDAGWLSLADMSAAKVISYLIVFAVTIAVLFVGRSIFFRR